MSGSTRFLSRPVLFGIGIFLLIAAIYLVTRHPPAMPGDAASESTLVLYSGRSEDLIKSLLLLYEEETGTKIQVRYGKSAEMAATILEEGENSPADLFFAQDAGSLGALAKKGSLAPLPAEISARIEPRFRSQEGKWVGVSGRARVVVYNSNKLNPEDLPTEVFGFCKPEWSGRIGWAPANGSFQAFVTALRAMEGEERAREWLLGIQKNEPQVYPKNSPIVAAVGAGEVDVGFVNHYYLFRFLAEQGESFPARNAFLASNDAGSLVNVAGIGILHTSKRKETAAKFVTWLLEPDAQEYFSTQNYEYPLAGSVPPSDQLPPLDRVDTPDLDLTDLEDLEGTLKLLQETGIL
jgi:iron(III) transport system substrate-binding protein